MYYNLEWAVCEASSQTGCDSSVLHCLRRCYRLRNRPAPQPSLLSHWMTTARTAKPAKRLETMMHFYDFEDSELETILSFLGPFKIPCDFDRVLQVTAVWFFLFSIAEPPAVTPTIRVTPWKDITDNMKEWPGAEERKRAHSYAKAVNY